MKAELIIDRSDIDDTVLASLEVLQEGDSVLGLQDRIRAVADALPKAVAKRMSKMIPEDFSLKELEITFKLGGELFGVAVGGDVKIKMSPKAGAQ